MTGKGRRSRGGAFHTSQPGLEGSSRDSWRSLIAGMISSLNRHYAGTSERKTAFGFVSRCDLRAGTRVGRHYDLAIDDLAIDDLAIGVPRTQECKSIRRQSAMCDHVAVVGLSRQS